jgi:uncharacterized NAD-dependent epimerase/dehydratase family protein
MTQPRRMIILTDGSNDPHTAKTANCVLRYRPEEVVAVLDRAGSGRTTGELMGVGGKTPVVGSLDDAPAANTLLIGIAPPGGKMPPRWRPIILEAIRRGMTVVSGLHEFLSEDAEYAAAAAAHGAALVDLRRCDERDVAHRKGIRAGCLRLHTIANDCSCGKMVAAVELADGLRRAGVDAQFVATGQTGILIAGGGVAVDRVIADFVAGAAEKLVLANQHHEVIVVEGQGSLFHPRYSGVTLSLLHGILPDGLIYCYEMGRQRIDDMPECAHPPHERVIAFYEAAARIMHPCRVVGVAVNGQRFPAEAVAAECRRVEKQLGLPACDVIRQGPEKLVEAALRLREEIGK